jgi:hypothetical protein
MTVAALRLRLHAIGAVIDPAGVRIAHDHHVAGADVIAAVVLVPARHRDLENVDAAAGQRIVHHRPTLDSHRRNGACFLHVAPPVMNELGGARVGIEPERDIDAANRGQDVGEDPVAAGITGNIVEQDCLVANPPLINIDDAADLELAIGTPDVLQLAGRPRLRDPGAQILTFLRGGLFSCARFDGRIHNRNSA